MFCEIIFEKCFGGVEGEGSRGGLSADLRLGWPVCSLWWVVVVVVVGTKNKYRPTGLAETLKNKPY